MTPGFLDLQALNHLYFNMVLPQRKSGEVCIFYQEMLYFCATLWSPRLCRIFGQVAAVTREEFSLILG
jgi:hypothetical protein